ncbi:PREDICTED: kinesin-like protein KIF18A [Chinchilla lanigera]|uniref:Kinesin-like protein n=1 Tax=Chinchilla lanigera TaxID=34839 RepID=A0A8C2UM68_CHILA|nr:PREDICTED: kinesin-like protein KIF18A [Chinchilla lanigera]
MSVPAEDLCHHMKVVIRVRPENTKEKAAGLHKVVQVVDKHILIFDPKQEEVSFFPKKKTTNFDISKRQNKDLKFVFDTVFDETSTQLEVFEHTTKPILRSFLNGYNCTVLAYGATGAGKTHTMLGSAAEPGVMYLTMLDLYKCMDEIKEEKICSTAVSYLEVYNEQIRDLLVNSGPLAVREDTQKGVVVQGLSLHQPRSSQEILQLLDNGNKNRTQHPTDANATSSRSHAVFQIYLRQQDKTASINQNIRIAKMSLIDLAGSERASSTSATGTRFVEGTNINRSLLALGNVINALADTKKKNQHVPYRNSKLTRLLKDSLGGNCQTIMIAAVSPSSLFYDDTYNTLKYANRAKDIKSSLKSNVLNLNNHISQYVKICTEQKAEILMLKEKLKAYEEQKAYTDKNDKTTLMISNPQDKEIQRFQEILNCLFQNREEIRQEYLKLEMLLKENELKSFYQQQCHKQIEMMCSEDKVEKATCKRDHRLAMLKTRRCYLEKKREEELKQFDENTSWLHRVESEMGLLGQNGRIPKELSKELHVHHLHLQNKDLKAQIRHMIDLACLQEQQHRQTEAVLNALLPSLRRQYCTLKEAGLSNAAFESDFKEIEHLVERKKVVVWADQTTEPPNQKDLPGISVLMTFPQLVPVQSIPCTSSGESNLLQIPPHKRTRRKLMPSPLKAKHTEKSETVQLNDSLTKELQPILYTPENYRKTVPYPSPVALVKPSPQTASFPAVSSRGSSGNPLATSGETDTPLHWRAKRGQASLNSTFSICEDARSLNSKLPEQESLPNNKNVLERLAPPSLSTTHPIPVSSSMPSYMAMTAAAKKKRKLASSTSSNPLTAEENHGFAKRVRQDNAGNKLLQENSSTIGHKKNIHKLNSNMARKFGRDISKGNVR